MGEGELGNSKVSIVYSIRMGEGELGNSKVSIVYSIRMGEGGRRTMLGGRYIHCAPSPLLYQT